MIRRLLTNTPPGTALRSLFAVGVLGAGCTHAAAEWHQWGGPTRDFKVQTTGLATQWPEDGPKKLWQRELGDGYSTIIADQGVLYTMYRVEEDEFTIAVDADSGKTLWQHKNASPSTQLMKQFGPGPHATPIIVGDKLYTIGTNAVLHCYDKKSGDVKWKHDLVAEFDAPIPGRGYGCSPLAYKNLLIVAVDRKREQESPEGDEQKEPEKPAKTRPQSLVAFDRTTGNVVWTAEDLPVSYASPIIINFQSEDHLVFLMQNDIVGLDPDTGDRLWHLDLEPEGANISTPVWNGTDLLFCSSAYDSGARVIRLAKKGDKTLPEQLWYSRKMRVHHGNVIRLGDYVYGSSGDFGPAFFMGVEMRTGKIAWRERGFKKANCLYGDGKMILLDEDGDLALTTVTPQGLTVHSRTKIAEPYAWAAPTLVGTTLYVRDRKHMMAFDLSS
ncbi:MAG: PQQ-like beta-propeller repeat protein [Phycisphaerae bacterium]|jgi:outer membrane protein assembly factor BamB